MSAPIIVSILLLSGVLGFIASYYLWYQQFKQECLRNARNNFLRDGVKEDGVYVDDERKYWDSLEDQRKAHLINECDTSDGDHYEFYDDVQVDGASPFCSEITDRFRTETAMEKYDKEKHA